MKPTIFGDAETEMVDYLENAFAPRSESYKATSVSTTFPTASGYHVQVEVEAGNADDYPVTERAQVRFNCWAPAGKRTDVKRLASLTMALVYTFAGTSAACSNPRILGGRSDVTTDPDTGYLMCWFLARVDLKPTVLAS